MTAVFWDVTQCWFSDEIFKLCFIESQNTRYTGKMQSNTSCLRFLLLKCPYTAFPNDMFRSFHWPSSGWSLFSLQGKTFNNKATLLLSRTPVLRSRLPICPMNSEWPGHLPPLCFSLGLFTQQPFEIINKHWHSAIIIIIIYLSWSCATWWPVPVSHTQMSLQRSTMIPSTSWVVVFNYPG